MDQSASKGKLNKSVALMIINWFNSLMGEDTNKHIKSLKDLSDGKKLLNLVQLYFTELKTKTTLSQVEIETNVTILDGINNLIQQSLTMAGDTNNTSNANIAAQVDQIFDAVRMIIEHQLRIEGKLDYKAAKQGNEYQLALICFIITWAGFARDLYFFQQATDHINKDCYDTLNIFFHVINKTKDKGPNNKPRLLQTYEDFLCISDNKRKSMSKQSPNNRMSILSGANSGNGGSSSAAGANTPGTPSRAVNYRELLSPLAKSYISNTPKEKSKHAIRRLEEELQRCDEEKKKIDGERKRQMYDIIDLKEELANYQKQTADYETKIDEYKRKLVELNIYKDRNLEFDEREQTIKKVEKERDYYEDKCKKYVFELHEANEIRNCNVDLQAQLNKFKQECEKLSALNQSTNVQVQSLKNVQVRYEQSLEKGKQQEQQILELINDRTHLEAQCKSWDKRCKEQQHELEERIELLTNENALCQNEANAFKAQLTQLREDSESKQQEMDAAMDEQLKSYESLFGDFEYQRTLGQQARAELSTLQLDYDLSKKQLFFAKEEADEYKNKANLLTADIRRAKEELNAQLKSLSDQLDAEKKETSNGHKLRKQESSQAKEVLEKREKQMRSEQAALQEQLLELQGQIAHAQNEHKLFEEKYAADQCKWSRDTAELNERVQELIGENQSCLVEIQTFKMSASQQQQEFEEKCESLQTHLRESQTETEELKEASRLQCDQYELLVKELRVKLTAMENANEELTNKKREQERKYAELSEEKAQEFDRMRNENSQVQEEHGKRMQEFQANLDALTTENARLLQDYQGVEELRVNLNEEKEALEIKLRELNTQLDQKHQDFQNLEKFLNDFQADKLDEIKQYDAEADQLRGDLDASRQTSAGLQVKLDMLSDEVKLKQEELARQEQQLTDETSKYELKLDELTAQFSQKEQRVNAYVNELQEAHAKEISRLSAQIEETDQAIGCSKEENEKLKMEVDDWRGKFQTGESLLAELRNEKSELTNKLTAKQVELSDRETKYADLEQKLATTSADLVDHKQKVQLQSQQIVTLKQELSNANINAQATVNVYAEKLQSLEARLKSVESERSNTSEEMRSRENQLREELNRVQSQLSEANTDCGQMRSHVNNMEAEYAKGLEVKRCELQAAHQQLIEATRKMNEYELNINQLIVDKENLAVKVQQNKTEYSQLSQKFLNSSQQAETELKKFNEQLRLEREQNAAVQKRLRDEAHHKQNELDSLKQRIEDIQVEHKRNNEAHETQNKDLESQLKDKTTLSEDLFNQVKSLTSFNTNFEQHYKIKKEIFQTTEKQNKELESKLKDVNLILEQSRRENSRLTQENTQLESRLVEMEHRCRQQNEEVTMWKEKTKTVEFENRQLKWQKDELTKKLASVSESDTVSDHRITNSTILTSTASKPTSYHPAAKASANFPETPKHVPHHTSSTSRFHHQHHNNNNNNNNFDDMFKTPSIIPNEYQNHNDDNLRRYSVDSISTSRSSNTSTQIPPQFNNRFNTISENEFEEPTANMKFLVESNPAQQQHRLSTLQTRNQQSKPHLKSSYALEEFSAVQANEELVKGSHSNHNHTMNKENSTGRLSDVSGLLKKRPYDEMGEAKSPKKSNTLKQTNM